MSETQTDRIAQAFCNCTLPKEEWTHEAHLRVGLWHLLRYSPSEAIGRLRQGIRQYNTACGVANTDTSGYHETITQFYVWAIAHFLEDRDRSQPVDRLAAELLDTCGDKHLPFIYYSKERLMSREARRHWVESDLVPMPQLRSGCWQGFNVDVG